MWQFVTFLVLLTITSFLMSRDSPIQIETGEGCGPAVFLCLSWLIWIVSVIISCCMHLRWVG